ncbi:hypothetical protein QR680_017964 [Steinernema hermaphroditum]|uniref:Uncharacterized protein n=1 Tax=Steinernema hermaphroditum TaxID=289476 RepID=A0AA39HH63_9BILA|nr:hypothetical protein QR680_017964 [Steinernema hermaphroditum]
MNRRIQLLSSTIRPLFKSTRSPLCTNSPPSTSAEMQKPLRGVKVVEIVGLAPVPYCGLVLADFGADVTILAKETATVEQRLNRGKKTVTVDFKSTEGIAEIREMCLNSDVLLDPFRPGVLENMGLDPVDLLAQNKKLIVARLTGYGQTGKFALEAGHDINYVSMTGLLPTLAGRYNKPYWPPANILADFAGGGLTAAFGVVAALFQREQNGGQGSIVDVSMVDGLSYLGSFVTMYKDIDLMWNHNYAFFSGACPIYRTYETKDGKYMAVGALERKFNAPFFKVMGVKAKLSDIMDKTDVVVKELEEKFKTKTRDEWVEIFKDADCCVTPVLDIEEVGNHPHHQSRGGFKQVEEKWVPEPAPRIYSAEQFKKLRDEDLKSKI